MGFGSYDTPLGLAGYNVEDTCHQDGCAERIDRGLAYLCGDQPGVASEGGCGRWFCGKHLFGVPDGAEAVSGGGFCRSCVDEWKREQAAEVTV